MDKIDIYTNNIQEYIKHQIPDINIDIIINYLKLDNVQAIINQSFNKQINIKEIGDRLIDMYKNKKYDISIIDDNIGNSRTSNKLEHILYFNEFKLLLESKI